MRSRREENIEAAIWKSLARSTLFILFRPRLDLRAPQSLKSARQDLEKKRTQLVQIYLPFIVLSPQRIVNAPRTVHFSHCVMMLFTPLMGIFG